MNIYTSIHICIYTHKRIYVCLYIYIYTHRERNINICVYTSLSLCIHMYIYIYIYIYVYIHTNTYIRCPELEELGHDADRPDEARDAEDAQSL